ncbi:hypothetical protein [Flavobacterium selenitireducens]|uniref:hypothetical protein n=1 Tax=Flavobacterium selenitireducens TaxID=2722704 RepID=UPI00168B733A|nr:hypothetical protein [Flavobacterium selenitireducens]MBD3583349.1 hypothetical protein [Flavobacterium selenitireducens]
MNPNKDYNNDLNNLESDNDESRNLREHADEKIRAVDLDNGKGDDFDFSSPDKYLAMEQKGVSFTPDADPMALNPDNIEFRQHGQLSDEFDLNNRNSRNAEAFSQDEYILRDNIDLDEDQSQSISSDEEIDTNEHNDGL